MSGMTAKMVVSHASLVPQAPRTNGRSAPRNVAPKLARGVQCRSAQTDEIIEKMKNLSLLEASELVKQIEDTFGVDASAPAGGMVAAAPAQAQEEEQEEEKTNFDLVITEVDDSQRIGAIKVLRGLTNLGLKEAKDAMSDLPYTVLEQQPKETVEDAKKQLEDAGAKVDMK